jgi:hypothetical protein
MIVLLLAFFIVAMELMSIPLPIAAGPSNNNSSNIATMSLPVANNQPSEDKIIIIM